MLDPYGPGKDLASFLRSKLAGEGNEDKQRVISDTAELAIQLLASYRFYIENPDNPTREQIESFRQDVERYGKRAEELRIYADHSNAPDWDPGTIQLLLDAQEAYEQAHERADEAIEDSQRVLDMSVEELAEQANQNELVSNVDLDTSESIDTVLDRVEDDAYYSSYTLVGFVAEECAEYLESGEYDQPEFIDELELMLEFAIERSFE